MFNDQSVKALVEVLKSGARFLWFGFLGLVGTWLISLAADPAVADARVQIAGTSFSVGFLLVAGIGTAVKALDRFIHKNDNIDISGLAPSILQK